jgi:hypothetical protein
MEGVGVVDVSKDILLRMSDDLYADFEVTYPRDRLSYTTDEELTSLIVEQLKYVLTRCNLTALLAKLKEKRWHIHANYDTNEDREKQDVMYVCSCENE